MIKLEFSNQWKYVKHNCMGINLVEINVFNMFGEISVLRIGLFGFSVDLKIIKMRDKK